MESQNFLKRCLFLDLEACDSRVYHIGAIYNEKVFERKGHFNLPSALEELDALAKNADFVLGHNLVDHDIVLIRSISPDLALLKKPVVDTLFLSPLAFPENPYHRLIKNYKLVKSSLNDPVADARLASSVFADEWNAFKTLKDKDLLKVYHFCFDMKDAGDSTLKGLKTVFDALGIAGIAVSELQHILNHFLYGKVCAQAAHKLLRNIDHNFPEKPALAYSLSWLSVSGGNSVLPPWVRMRFPSVVNILHELRDVPCKEPSCTYCRTVHCPSIQLKRYFGFKAFRPSPGSKDGTSLQENIVFRAIAGKPLLAILPTSGGKSLCYQLPALVQYFRRGLLTVVISPLQALMRDQVDNLSAKTGIPNVAALHGLLTPPERGEILDRIRLGDIAIVYVSPEQLRNPSFGRAIEFREIAAWVFDEAHCLSKWGHDFRSDYLYASRFIREFAQKQNTVCPPVACFTATAKKDVIEEILAHFKQNLGQELEVLKGGIERENLCFEVRMVSSGQKYAHIYDTLQTELSESKGAAVVYTAKRKEAEKTAQYLQKKGIAAASYHAGMSTAEKKEIQDSFLRGDISVICATNAFGMGIDKEDVRLVLHASIPGSLENYLQEAGRAGRDNREAKCILLYNENDTEKQFRLQGRSELTRRDIAQILRILRRLKKNRSDEIVVTAGELLRDEEIFDALDPMADTKVKTAIAWLERAGFLERNQNNVRVFQGTPLINNLDEARKKIALLHLSEQTKTKWMAVLEALINTDNARGLNIEELAELPVFKNPGLSSSEQSLEVFRVLHEMTQTGLIKEGLVLTAYVRYKVVDSSSQIFQKVCGLDKAMLELMQELAPDGPEEGELTLSISRLNQGLKNAGHKSNPETLRLLLKSLSLDGKDVNEGSLQILQTGRDHYKVQLKRPWSSIVRLAEKRRAVAEAALKGILGRIPKTASAGANLLVSFTSSDISDVINSNLYLAGQIHNMMAAVNRGLMFLHEQKVITLNTGLAVFRQAMTIRVNSNLQKRGYTKGDYEPLGMHYRERVFQIHVMNEYARIGIEKINKALRLVLAYFSMDKKEFMKLYFAQNKEMLERATGQDSYRRIVEELNNPSQTAVVAAHEERNMLVLAGPGSGKTRAVVHRCAYLLRVLRVKPSSILVVCFNRSAVMTIRKRLFDLVGDDAKGVTVQTYHGLAMTLTGTSFKELLEHKQETVDFDSFIHEAVRLLRGQVDIPGLEPDEVRDRVLEGYRHILVDEYQDIDESQYELISALAGRTEKDSDGKLTILAVGDDDQNIYAFRGANIRFIRQFREDYEAGIHYLVENYRSTRHIIGAASQLISGNKDRMKTDQPIVINKNRLNDPPGGRWTALDPVAKGRVQLLQVDDVYHQALALVEELKRLSRLSPDFIWSDYAVIGRTHRELWPIRALLEDEGIPVRLSFDAKKSFPLFRVRETTWFIDMLKAERKELKRASELIALLDNKEGNPWQTMLYEILTAWSNETADTEMPVEQAIEYLYEVLGQQRKDAVIGSGVFLCTVHSAKGMEFPHVLIPGGDWFSGKSGQTDLEEERRIFYTAMTRARETLCLFELTDKINPHTCILNGDFLFSRRGPEGKAMDSQFVSRRYELLGMQDMFLDFAGRHPESHPIHKRLAALNPGSALRMIQDGEKMLLLDSEGFCVAALSRAGTSLWQKRLSRIQGIWVVAMLCREKKELQEQFKDKCLCEKWELPLAEVVYSWDDET